MNEPYMNNSKEIIRGYKNRFKKNPSESLAHKIEVLSGEVADFSEKDAGEEPKRINE